jgi:hypothetical protein
MSIQRIIRSGTTAGATPGAIPLSSHDFNVTFAGVRTRTEAYPTGHVTGECQISIFRMRWPAAREAILHSGWSPPQVAVSFPAHIYIITPPGGVFL